MFIAIGIIFLIIVGLCVYTLRYAAFKILDFVTPGIVEVVADTKEYIKDRRK